MKKKILVASGLAVAGMGITALIIRKRKKKTNSEIDFLESDDFDDEDVCDLDSLTDEELDRLAEDLLNEIEKRCRAELEDDKKSQEEAGCRSR